MTDMEKKQLQDEIRRGEAVKIEERNGRRGAVTVRGVIAVASNIVGFIVAVVTGAVTGEWVGALVSWPITVLLIYGATGWLVEIDEIETEEERSKSMKIVVVALLCVVSLSCAAPQEVTVSDLEMMEQAAFTVGSYFTLKALMSPRIKECKTEADIMLLARQLYLIERGRMKP